MFRAAFIMLGAGFSAGNIAISIFQNEVRRRQRRRLGATRYDTLHHFTFVEPVLTPEAAAQRAQALLAATSPASVPAKPVSEVKKSNPKPKPKR